MRTRKNKFIVLNDMIKFFTHTSHNSPILYFFIISLASVEWPTSSNDSVASLPACSIRTSSPPGC